jgi:hypothetical protein
MREKYLHNIDDVELYINLACDENLFLKYIIKKIMDLSQNEFDKYIIDKNNKDLLSVIKSNEFNVKIKTLFWIENLLNIKRYDVNNIKCVNLDEIKMKLTEKIDDLYIIFKLAESKSKTRTRIKNRIISIDNFNLMQKFIAECYNFICNDIIIITYHKGRDNKLSYYTFS